MSWQVVLTADGSYTLAHPVHGQTCHSRAGAWQEARERYAQACRLRERAEAFSARARGTDGRPVLRLLDVGTGLGLNLAAALEALDGTDVALAAVSLEHDTSVIAAVLELHDRLSEPSKHALPAELERWHAPVRQALAATLLELPRLASATGLSEARVPLAGGSLRLVVGDARSTLASLSDEVAFDAVFLDPFSPAVDPPLWEFTFLSEVARRMCTGSWLSTYTSSLAVRARLLAAGLSVGPGGRVGTKACGTLATRGNQVSEFDPRTARRLQTRAAACRIPSRP